MSVSSRSGSPRKFLLDACLPARTAELLRAAGHDCVHVYDGHGEQPGERIMARADHQGRISIFADVGFGELLAMAPVLAPSVTLLRRADKDPAPSLPSPWPTSDKSPMT
jgi:predicted nuclease of predicted toxin-antitoxin system